MRSKYYLFITDPVVEGIDSLDETKVTFRISALKLFQVKGHPAQEYYVKKFKEYLFKKVLNYHNQFILK